MIGKRLVKNMIIWGNHSATQYPDFTNAKINGAPATDAITDRDWLEGEFISTVQKRGAAIIKARGLSSAASAANAIIDSVRSITEPTAEGDWHSVWVCSDGSYDVEEGLISSFPMRNSGGEFGIVQDVPERTDFSQFYRGEPKGAGRSEGATEAKEKRRSTEEQHGTLKASTPKPNADTAETLNPKT